MKQFTFTMSEALHEKLRVWSYQNRQSISDFIRSAIIMMLEKEGENNE